MNRAWVWRGVCFGLVFSLWGVACRGRQPTRSPAPAAKSAERRATVSLTIVVHGPGSIAVNGHGECSDECEYTLTAGTRVTLSPTQTEGARFVRWNSMCNETPCSFPVNGETRVTASFSRRAPKLDWFQAARGADHDRVNGIAATGERVYVAVTSNSPTLTIGSNSIVGGSGRDATLVELTPNGDVGWAFSVGGSHDEFAADVAVAEGVGVFFGISYRDETAIGTFKLRSSERAQGALVLLDPDTGSPVWARNVDGVGSDMRLRVVDGDVFVVGNTRAARITAAGSIVWERTFSSRISGVTVCSDNSVYVSIPDVDEIRIFRLRGNDGADVWSQALAVGKSGTSFRLSCLADSIFFAGGFTGPITISGETLSKRRDLATVVGRLRRSDGALATSAILERSAVYVSNLVATAQGVLIAGAAEGPLRVDGRVVTESARSTAMILSLSSRLRFDGVLSAESTRVPARLLLAGVPGASDSWFVAADYRKTLRLAGHEFQGVGHEALVAKLTW